MDVEELLTQLTLEEKVQLTSGVGWWHTAALERLSIPPIRLSDGPNGVRGTHFFDSTPSACLPCGTALGATWDVDLIHRLGLLLSDEAHAKGAHVLLGPTVNIQRGPLGGRGFESFSEDPILSGVLAGHYVRGVQKSGVSATMKHFVCNDMESARMAVDVQVTERALREIYLLPFMIAVEMANPRLFMTAYNKVNGTHAPDNQHLLRDILRDEWKWDGLVVSDWFGSYSTTEGIEAGQDLEMPGPSRCRGDALVHSVRSNKVKQSKLDERVRNVLKLVKHSIENTNIPPNAPETKLNTKAHIELLREAAAKSIVLLKNDGNILPLNPAKRVAVIGPNAEISSYCGGGSAGLRAYDAISPLEGIRDIAGDVVFAKGAYGHKSLPQMGKLLRTVDGCRTGFSLRVYNDPYSPSAPRHALEERFLDDSNVWFVDYEHPELAKVWYAEIEGVLTPEVSGEWDFGLSVHGTGELFIDGELVISNVLNQRAGSAFLGSGTVEETGTVRLEAGQGYNVLARWGCSLTSDLKVPGVVDFGQGGLRLGGCPRLAQLAALDEAVRLAKSVDQVVLCVGTSGEWESEGQDRTTMALPPGSDDLVAAILAANPNTVVLIQSGTPISMPWIDQAKAVAQAWFGGNEADNGIADVLFGVVNPSGKLPLTMPRRVADTPSALSFRSEGGRVLYSEDIHVGYRWYDTLDIEPLFPFGHGLSYTTFALSDLSITIQSTAPDEIIATVRVSNTGSLAGAAVVEAYVKPPQPTALSASSSNSITRSSKELKAFARVDLQPNTSSIVELRLDLLRATSYWSEIEDCWRSEAGDYTLLVGTSSRCEFLEGTFRGQKATTWKGLRSRPRTHGGSGNEADVQVPANIHVRLIPNAPTPSASASASAGGVVVPEQVPYVARGQPPALAYCEGLFPTDELCPRDLFMLIMRDYIDRIYPLVPVVHLPTFRAELAANRDVEDLDFLSLIIALVALTIGLLPSRFDDYQAMASRFGTRTAAISCCSQLCLRLRPADYWDQVSHRKWAVAYTLSIGSFQTGQMNQSRMFDAEAIQVARLLCIHSIPEYDGLNCIETQLRKKAFWLQFYSYTHSKVQPGRRNHVTYLDNSILRDVDFDGLEPLNVADDHILETGVVDVPPTPLPAAQHPASPSVDDESFNVVSAFIVSSRAFLKGMGESIINDGCNCGFGRSPEERLSRLRDLLDGLRYILDGLPPHMRQWGSGNAYQSPRKLFHNGIRQDLFTEELVAHAQNEIARANIHISHLWLQSFLLDKMDFALQEMSATAIQAAGDTTANSAHLKLNWREREDICRQLLHILHSIPQAYLEPNGLFLPQIYKVRDVASSLMNCPFVMDEQLSRRASEYVQEFSKVLSYLDRSEIVNTDGLKSWIDEDRQNSRAV
ncbi:hypothetical protein ACJ41O_012645 [Fusarium nematophilum]